MSDKEKLEGAKTEKKAKPAEKKPGVFARIGKWLRELKSELKKVQWPSKKQTVNNTLVVIACIVVVGIFIWVFDAAATAIINAVLHLAGK
jgi:preprotein translocase subunit SecE